MRAQADVIVVGAGHNGLVAALMLARRGLDVLVLEEKDVVGGAARTERPFARVPGLATSTGAYLLGLMPPELLRTLGIELPLLRRDPHYFLPTTGKRYLLFGSNANAMREQFLSFFSEQDWRANEALQREISAIRDDVAPTWLEEPLSLEDTAAKYVRPALRQIFVDLCRKPVGQYLDRFGFRSDLLKAMYAVTDGFSGLSGDWDTPGTGMNFLVHNMCRLPGSDGTWMIVRGGMGTVTQTLAGAARQAGATIETGRGARAIATGPLRVSLHDGTEVRARAVVVNADPFRLRELIGGEKVPEAWNARVEGYRRDGTTLKVNLALKELPRFTCLPHDRGQFGTTMHLLPDEPEVMEAMHRAFADVKAGRLPVPDHRVVRPHHRRPFPARRAWAPQLRALRAVGAVRAFGHELGCGRIALRAPPPPHLRSLRTGHLGARRRCFSPDAAEDRTALRDLARPHPPRRQLLRIRRSPPLCDTRRRRVLVQRGLPPRRLGDRGGRAQCRRAGLARSRRLTATD